MPKKFDVIVVGLGAMGSAAAFHLARRGARVLGLDRFTPPHTLGSSHGRTRIIREAYFEHPLYVPLVQRAYELWRELEHATGERLLQITGGLMIGHPDGVVIHGSRRSAEQHGLPHEILSSAQIKKRFPVFRPDAEMIGIREPRAGILFPEACVAAHLAQARRHGATLRFDEPVRRWEPRPDGVRVHTNEGAHEAARLLLTAGSWVQELLPDWKLPLTIERQVLHWFAPKADAARFLPARCPIHLWEHAPGKFFYGFPDLGDGVKVARHHEGEPCDPSTIRREVSPDEVESMRTVLRRFLPGADGPLLSSVVCLYTNTPDGHFWIDQHPEHSHVTIASPCSGHGFKFSSALGEALSDLLSGKSPAFDLSLFRSRKF